MAFRRQGLNVNFRVISVQNTGTFLDFKTKRPLTIIIYKETYTLNNVSAQYTMIYFSYTGETNNMVNRTVETGVMLLQMLTFFLVGTVFQQ